MKNLGSQFWHNYVKKSHYCVWPDHEGARRVKKGSAMKQLSIDLCTDYFKQSEVSLPYDGLLCHKCQFTFYVILKDGPGSSMSTSTLGTVSGSSLMSVDPQDPEFVVEVDPFAKMMAFNNFLEANRCKTKQLFVLNKRFDSYARQKQGQTLALVGTGVNAILQTVTQHHEDCQVIWNEVLSSNAVEKRMDQPPIPNAMLEDIILAYNGCTNRNERIPILSLLPGHFSFSQLKKFNSADIRTEDGEPDGSDGSDDEADGAAAGASVAQWCGFSPPLTYHTYRQAQKHYMTYAALE